MDHNPVLAWPDHAKCFGYIISIFAWIETQMHVIAAGMIGSDLLTAIILMNGTQYRQKRRTLKNLNRTLGINGRANQELDQILDDLHKFSQLRNRIAHATWTNGHRPGSIKPMVAILSDDDEPNLLGVNHNERDWTVDDLMTESRKLEAVSLQLARLITSTGMGERVQAMIDKSKPSISADPGNPSSR